MSMYHLLKRTIRFERSNTTANSFTSQPTVFSPGIYPSMDHVTTHLNRLLDTRSFPKTICPSEAARSLSTLELQQIGAASWRELMPNIRALAFELRARGELEILQKGHLLPASQTLDQTIGPIRLRRTNITGNQTT